MAENSSLVTRQCMAWKTERPYINRLRVSPDFTFQISSWNLNIGFSENSEYCIQLKRKFPKQLFCTFDVTTYLESPTGGSVLYQTVTVTHTPHLIWRAHESNVLENIPTLKDYGEFTVVCVFRRFNDYSDTKLRLEPVLSQNQANVSANMESLSSDIHKLFQSDLFPDVKLKCKDRVFPAHRALLAARSEVFAAMFRNKMVESETRVVDIIDVEATILELLLNYLYSGKIPDLSEDTVRSLYAASDKYAVFTLKKECCEWIINDLTAENCLDILRLADAHDDRAFKDRVIAFISDNKGILQSDDWAEFSEEDSGLAVQIYHKFFAKEANKKDKQNPSSTAAFTFDAIKINCSELQLPFMDKQANDAPFQFGKRAAPLHAKRNFSISDEKR